MIFTTLSPTSRPGQPGFDHADGSTIAYCAQYVDDAVKTGIICFQNQALYNRGCSAHKMVDYRNIKALANHRVWLPFHFLPGNDGCEAGDNPPLTRIPFSRFNQND